MAPPLHLSLEHYVSVKHISTNVWKKLFKWDQTWYWPLLKDSAQDQKNLIIFTSLINFNNAENHFEVVLLGHVLNGGWIMC